MGLAGTGVARDAAAMIRTDEVAKGLTCRRMLLRARAFLGVVSHGRQLAILIPFPLVI
jgi:hypothetical protein